MAKALEKAPPHAHERMIKGKMNATLFSPFVFPYMHYILSTEGEATVEQYWKEAEQELEVTAQIGKVISWKCK
jgi:translation elongation factor EF-Ts